MVEYEYKTRTETVSIEWRTFTPEGVHSVGRTRDEAIANHAKANKEAFDVHGQLTDALDDWVKPCGVRPLVGLCRVETNTITVVSTGAIETFPADMCENCGHSRLAPSCSAPWHESWTSALEEDEGIDRE